MVQLKLKLKDGRESIMYYDGEEESRLKFNAAMKSGFIVDYEVTNEKWYPSPRFGQKNKNK